MAYEKSKLKKYGFLWVTLVLFLSSLAAHWTFSWKVYVREQEEKRQPLVVSDFLQEVSRDTFENWQSEFLQLAWQVAGLAILLYAGSPQSKEGDERIEEKLDHLLRHLDKEDGEKLIQNLKRKYPDK